LAGVTPSLDLVRTRPCFRSKPIGEWQSFINKRLCRTKVRVSAAVVLPR